MVTSIIEALAHIVIYLISTLGYFGVFFAMTLESVGIPLPSEIIMPFSGYLVYKGEFNFWLVVLCGTLGNLVGSLAAYYIGLFGGRPFLERYGKYFLFTRHDLDLAEKWFKKYGRSTVFFSRLLPIIRTYISFPAGMSGMDVKAFSLYTFLGALPFCLLLTFIGYFLGENWQTIGGFFREFDLLIGVLLVAGIIWYIWRHLKHRRSAHF